jgi:perosamine synthetase
MYARDQEGIAASAATGMFHFTEQTLKGAKAALQAAAIPMRGLVPKKTGAEYVNCYWTSVCRNEHYSVGWNTLRDAFLANGGHGVYAAWKLTYLEPMFENLTLLGRERFISADNIAQYKAGLCPVAERLQKRLMQFKTNYWDIAQAHEQAQILRKTLKLFD